MMEKIIRETIQKTVLFNDIDSITYQKIISKIIFDIREYDKGDIVDDMINNQKALGFVLSGKLQAMKHLMSGKSMYLKAFKSGNIFGAGGLFQNKVLHLSYMEVTSKAQVAFITEGELLKLFKYEDILLNYLRFMNTRVQYLNQKIDIISQSTIYDRLKMYFYDQQLLQKSKQEIILPISKSDLAEFIGVSRASLYRILDDMEKDSIIKIHHNKVIFM